jgi:hypothetical protein
LITRQLSTTESSFTVTPELLLRLNPQRKSAVHYSTMHA